MKADWDRSRQKANRSIASCLLALARFRTPCGGWSRCFRRAARALLLSLRFDDHRALRVRIETQLRELHRVRDQRLDLRAVEIRNRVQLDVTRHRALTLQQPVRVRL